MLPYIHATLRRTWCMYTQRCIEDIYIENVLRRGGSGATASGVSRVERVEWVPCFTKRLDTIAPCLTDKNATAKQLGSYKTSI